MKIITPRLILRPIEQTDLDWFIRIYSNPQIMRSIYDGNTLSRELAIEKVNGFFQNWQKHGFGVWMVIEKSSLLMAGYCVFRFFSEQNSQLTNQIELGYIFDEPFWGKGYATEAVIACIKIGFETHQFDQIIATILPAHISSQKVAEKAGMKYVFNAQVDGLNHCIYEIKKSNYKFY